MYNLQKKIQEQKSKKSVSEKQNLENGTGRPSIRDYYLSQDIPDADDLHEIVLKVSPPTGYWVNGTFEFDISVPLEYNILPPTVCCRTKLWHPNIDTHGRVCLSILRSRSIDSTGWAPTRTIKDVVWGLNALFGDLLNFDDPLNVEAAEQYAQNKGEFEKKVKHYVNCYAR